jgi:hypothetical protein
MGESGRGTGRSSGASLPTKPASKKTRSRRRSAGTSPDKSPVKRSFFKKWANIFCKTVWKVLDNIQKLCFDSGAGDGPIPWEIN